MSAEERSLRTGVDTSWIRHPRHSPSIPAWTNALYFPSISQHFIRLQSVVGDVRPGYHFSPLLQKNTHYRAEENDLELKYVHLCNPEPVVIVG